MLCDHRPFRVPGSLGGLQRDVFKGGDKRSVWAARSTLVVWCGAGWLECEWFVGVSVSRASGCIWLYLCCADEIQDPGQ